MQVERWAARQGRRKPDESSWRPLAGVASMALLSSTTLLLGACDSTSEPQTTVRTDSAGIPITTALAPKHRPGNRRGLTFWVCGVGSRGLNTCGCTGWRSRRGAGRRLDEPNRGRGQAMLVRPRVEDHVSTP